MSRRTSLIRSLALAAILAAPAAARAQATLAGDSLALARQLTGWFYAGKADSLHARVAAESKAEFTLQLIQDQLAMLTARAGTEEKVIEEKFVKRNGRTQYWRTAKFTQMEEPVLLRWAFNDKHELIGAGLGPLRAAPPVDK